MIPITVGKFKFNVLDEREQKEDVIRSLDSLLDSGFVVEVYHRDKNTNHFINKPIKRDGSSGYWSLIEDDSIDIPNDNIVYINVIHPTDVKANNKKYKDVIPDMQTIYTDYKEKIDGNPLLLFRPTDTNLFKRRYMPVAPVFIMFGLDLLPNEDPYEILKSTDVTLKQGAIKRYKKVLRERIVQFNDEIDEEIEALKSDDELDSEEITEGIDELNGVRHIVNTLDSDVDLWSMESVFDILSYWPPLLLPAPDFIFENSVFRGT